MLNKTTSMLPEGLFASLGVTRTAETDMRGVRLVSHVVLLLIVDPSYLLLAFARISTILCGKLAKM
jgi:hypothetical protein